MLFLENGEPIFPDYDDKARDLTDGRRLYWQEINRPDRNYLRVFTLPAEAEDFRPETTITVGWRNLNRHIGELNQIVIEGADGRIQLEMGGHGAVSGVVCCEPLDANNLLIMHLLLPLEWGAGVVVRSRFYYLRQRRWLTPAEINRYFSGLRFVDNKNSVSVRDDEGCLRLQIELNPGRQRQCTVASDSWEIPCWQVDLKPLDLRTVVNLSRRTMNDWYIREPERLADFISRTAGARIIPAV